MQKEANEITIEGVKYVPAKVASRNLSYSQDYIGQLCRGDKIDAVRIGRSWYVNESSLSAHRDEKDSQDKEEENARPVQVSPRKRLPLSATNLFKESSFVVYQRDDRPLIPTLITVKQEEPVSIPIPIKIHAEDEPEIITSSIIQGRKKSKFITIRPKQILSTTSRALVATTSFAAMFLILFSLNGSYTGQLLVGAFNNVTATVVESEFIHTVDSEILSPFEHTALKINEIIDEKIYSIFYEN